MTPDPIVWAAVYLAGVVIGLVRVDAGPVGRLGVALLWPIGPFAFVITVAGLLAVALAAPVVGLAGGPRPR